MTRHSLTRGGLGLAMLLGLAGVLLAGQGLCGPVPEPLQNRQPAAETKSEDQTTVAPPAETPGGTQETRVIVTPSEPGTGIVVPGSVDRSTTVPTVPAEPDKDHPAVKTPDQTDVHKDKATGTTAGGLRDPHVLVAPPAVAVPNAVVPADKVSGTPGKTDVLPGKSETVPLPTKTTPTPAVVVPNGALPREAVPDARTAPAVSPKGPPLEVAADGKVLDAAGHPVDLVPGKPVVLPKGGKVVDAQGHVVMVPPGGQVIVPLTPGYFLPKTEPQGEHAKQPKQTKQPPPAKQTKQTKQTKPAVVPEPAPAPKPQTQAMPKSGDRFALPADACAKHSLDFLRGCWMGNPVLSDKSRWSTRFCFDEHGVGKRIDRNPSNRIQCVAPTQAKWSGDHLSFSSGKFYCSDGMQRSDVPVICSGCGGQTQCIGSEYRHGREMTGKVRYEIVKE